MSHHLKKPAPISPRERREEKQIRFMASQIKDQAALDSFLAGSEPAMREAMLERITPFLSFIPAEEVDSRSLDCPDCGMFRGTVIAHKCFPPK